MPEDNKCLIFISIISIIMSCPYFNIHYILFLNKFILFIFYFWLHWVFVAVHGLRIAVASLIAEHGAWASVAVAHRLSSCGART